MPENDEQNPPETSQETADVGAALPSGRHIGSLITPCPPDEIRSRLRTLSKRGKLPGFRQGRQTIKGALFDVDLFGTAFDQRLVALSQSSDGPTRLRLERRWKWKTPIIFAIVILVSIEPGATLLKSFLPNWGWMVDHLRWWYYPLTIAQIPFVWRMVPKSRAAAIKHAAETIEKLRPTLDASFEPAPSESN